MPPFKHFPKRPHVLLTPKTCPCDKSTEDRQCPVCDWGLGVCSVCGGGEADLVGTDCPGRKPVMTQTAVGKPKVPLWPCPNCEGLGRTKNNTKCAKCKGTGERKLEGRA